MLKIQLPIVQKFNKNVMARSLPLNFKQTHQSSFICLGFLFFSKACPNQNILQNTIITLLCRNKNIPNLIILVNKRLPTQNCSHYLLICSLHVLHVGNVDFL
jgi:hypothetical protein